LRLPRVIALPGDPARVLGPALARIAANGTNLDHTVAHLQIGRALQPHLGQDGFRNQYALGVAHLADGYLHDHAPGSQWKHNGSTPRMMLRRRAETEAACIPARVQELDRVPPGRYRRGGG